MDFLKKNITFILVLILIHGFYFCIALKYNNIYNLDSPEYLQQAKNLKTEGSIYAYYKSESYDAMFETLRPPAYGTFIFVLKSVINNDFFVLTIQNILSILTVLILLKSIQLFNFQKKIKLILTISLLLYPSQLVVSNSIWPDTFFQFILFVGFYYMLRFIRDKKVEFWIVYNIMLAIAILIKPVLLYFWIINLAYSIYLFYKLKKYTIIVFSMILPLVIGAWNFRNLSKTGYYHFSSIKTFNLLKYNSYKLKASIEGEENADAFVNEILLNANKFDNFKDQQKYISERSTEYLKENISAYALLHSKGILNYFMDPGRENIVDFFPLSDTKEISFFNEYHKNGVKGIINYIKNVNPLIMIYMVLSLVWNLLVLISLGIFVFYKKVDPLIKIGVLNIILYFSFLSGIVGNARYKMAVYFILIFIIPFTLKAIKERKIRRQTK